MSLDPEVLRIQQEFYQIEEDARINALRREREAERAACAELVRAAGCACDSLEGARAEREGIAGFKPPFGRVVIHDPRCPQALAASIAARGGKG